MSVGAATNYGSDSQGRRAARGGVVRAASYGVSLLLSLLSVPLLVRHLGVEGFGAYATATALVATGSLVADAGLTVLGVRDYAPLCPVDRRRLLATILALRLGLAFVGGAFAVCVAFVAGYGDAVWIGVAAAAAGMAVVMLQQTLTIPLIAYLRQGTVSALEVAAKALAVFAIVALVVEGAGLVWFLVIPLPVGLMMLAATAGVVRSELPAPRDLCLPNLRTVIRQAAPIAAATITTALFYRIAVIVLSLTSTEQETGYFALSLRLVEVIVPIPVLLASVVFPVLVAAAREDRARFADLSRRLVDVLLVVGGLVAVGMFAGADLLVRLIGGSDFASAADVLRLQAPALVATFLFSGWAVGLLALRRQGELVKATLLGVASVAVLTLVLGSTAGAQGAATAMTISEGVLAAATGVLLLRREAELRPRVSFVLKLSTAIAVPSVAVAVADLSDVAAPVVAIAMAVAVLVVSRALPFAEIGRLLRAGSSDGGLSASGERP